jgi:DNA polymerase II large subunit
VEINKSIERVGRLIISNIDDGRNICAIEKINYLLEIYERVKQTTHKDTIIDTLSMVKTRIKKEKNNTLLNKSIEQINKSVYGGS